MDEGAAAGVVELFGGDRGADGRDGLADRGGGLGRLVVGRGVDADRA